MDGYIDSLIPVVARSSLVLLRENSVDGNGDGELAFSWVSRVHASPIPFYWISATIELRLASVQNTLCPQS